MNILISMGVECGMQSCIIWTQDEVKHTEKQRILHLSDGSL